MPVHDFDNREDGTDHYNWGYMPVHFNSPDGWYASEAMGPVKIRELKAAIQAFHRKGIGVILDVVYNHTAEWAPFERLVPGYYHRMTPGGSFSNGSGCGNEFDSANPMARKFIVDSCRFWVEEYRVDGFRFDLMGLIDLETMREVKAELLKVHPGVLVYGEPWTGGATTLEPITNKHVVRGSGVAAFNDHFRDAIKGGRDGGESGFIQTGRNRDAIMRGLAGAIDDWSLDPLDSVNYFEAHDNLTAWDKLLQSAPEASEEFQRRMMRFASLILLSSQGMVFMHSGQEFCRTKQGSHNSYNLPDAINQIDWCLKKQHLGVFDYYRGLIALRKAHPEFRLRSAEEVRKRVSFPRGDEQAEKVILYRIDVGGLPGADHEITLAVFNGDSNEQTVALPGGEWSVVVDADRAGSDVFATVEGSVTLPPHSGMVLLQ
jgi:pullulanase